MCNFFKRRDKFWTLLMFILIKLCNFVGIPELIRVIFFSSYFTLFTNFFVIFSEPHFCPYYLLSLYFRPKSSEFAFFFQFIFTAYNFFSALADNLCSGVVKHHGRSWQSYSFAKEFIVHCLFKIVKHFGRLHFSEGGRRHYFAIWKLWYSSDERTLGL